MTMTQTVKVPDDRRIILDVPPQIPAGETARFEVIWFPVTETLSREELLMKLPPEKRISVTEEAELFKKHANELNAEAEDVLSYQWNPEDDNEA
jgi:hypothetical protein